MQRIHCKPDGGMLPTYSSQLRTQHALLSIALLFGAISTFFVLRPLQLITIVTTCGDAPSIVSERQHRAQLCSINRPVARALVMNQAPKQSPNPGTNFRACRRSLSSSSDRLRSGEGTARCRCRRLRCRCRGPCGDACLSEPSCWDNDRAGQTKRKRAYYRPGNHSNNTHF